MRLKKWDIHVLFFHFITQYLICFQTLIFFCLHVISRSQTQKSIIQICKKGEQFYSEPGILIFSGYLFCQHKPSRSKVRFAPTPFYAYGRKRRHPHAPLLLLSKLNPLTLGFNLGFSFSRTSYRSRRRFFFQNNRHRSFTPSLLLLQIEPAALGFNLGFYFFAF